MTLTESLRKVEDTAADLTAVSVEVCLWKTFNPDEPRDEDGAQPTPRVPPE